MSDPLSSSRGVIASHLQKGKLPPNERAVFRVLGTRPVENKSNASASSDVRKFRLALTDGDAKFTSAMLMVPEGEDSDDWLPAKNQMVDLRTPPGMNPANVMHTISGKHLFIVHNMRKIKEKGAMGTPTAARAESPAMPPKPPAKRPPSPSMQATQPCPSTSGTAAKRALFPPGAASSPSDLVPQKKTHDIRDLNPYQNKFTLCARVLSKDPIRSISNSRWSGEVFSAVLQDSTGEIKASAFDEHARKFHPLLEEGKAVFLSHAQIKNVHNRSYNTTGHNYELTLGQQTVVAPCRLNVQAPKPRYDFVPLKDIDRKADKDKVEVLGFVTNLKDLYEGTSRAGKGYKKRECTLMDDDGVEVQLTVWGDKGVSMGEADGKVVAVKNAYVSEWNGVKGVNVGFGASVDIEPDVDEAKYLKTWFAQNHIARPALNRTTSSSENDSHTAALGEIRMSATHSGVDDVANYFTSDVYLTSIRTDRMAYKACPEESCRRKVSETEAGGAYRCQKCAKTGPRFDWRYVLRGTIADATDSQWFTAFDEAAVQLLGKPAGELMELQESGAAGFAATIEAAKYKRVRVRLRCKNEMYESEKRLKLTLLRAEGVNGGSEAYKVRMRAAIEQMKAEMGISDEWSGL